MLSHSTQIFVGEPFCFSHLFWYWKILLTRKLAREGASITTFCRIFPSQSAEKLHRGTLPFFRKFLVSKKCRIERGDGYNDFPTIWFCLTLPNHFVDETFVVSERFDYPKTLCLRGEYHDFFRITCCLTVPKKFVRNTPLSHKLSGNGNCYEQGRAQWREGVSRFSVQKFCHRVPRKFVEEHFCVSEIFRFWKKLGLKEGRISRLSIEIILSRSTRKLRGGALSCFGWFRLTKNLKPESRKLRFSIKKFVVLEYRRSS